jgi:hypothetical protein
VRASVHHVLTALIPVPILADPGCAHAAYRPPRTSALPGDARPSIRSVSPRLSALGRWSLLGGALAWRAMSTVHAHGKVVVTGEPVRPYRNVPAGELADQIEFDFNDGKPFNEAIVFELVNRALEAEGLALKPGPRD